MKSLILVLSLLGFQPCFAGPGDGPIFVWPTNIERREITVEDLAGRWWGSSQTSSQIYIFNFSFEAEDPYRIEVEMQMAGQHVRSGLAYWGQNTFWGHMALDGQRYTRMIIYREEGRLKMRVEKYREGYVDLNLERVPWDVFLW